MALPSLPCRNDARRLIFCMMRSAAVYDDCRADQGHGMERLQGSSAARAAELVGVSAARADIQMLSFMRRFEITPTRLSIGDWNPCADGLCGRPDNHDTARGTEKINR
jgi:hypothetical protein